jgi:hypothetical protein
VLTQLTSDWGTQFTIWTTLCQQLGIQHLPTVAFHPQANGKVERCHRRLKNALRACLAGLDWPLCLPWVLMGLRAAPGLFFKKHKLHLILPMSMQKSHRNLNFKGIKLALIFVTDSF